MILDYIPISTSFLYCIKAYLRCYQISPLASVGFLSFPALKRWGGVFLIFSAVPDRSEAPSTSLLFIVKNWRFIVKKYANPQKLLPKHLPKNPPKFLSLPPTLPKVYPHLSTFPSPLNPTLHKSTTSPAPPNLLSPTPFHARLRLWSCQSINSPKIPKNPQNSPKILYFSIGNRIGGSIGKQRIYVSFCRFFVLFSLVLCSF